MTDQTDTAEGPGVGAPLATALVIGIGGSGLHVVSRLHAAVRDHGRPDVAAHENVVFLALDAADPDRQNLRLPRYSRLTDREFVNVVPHPVNAANLVRKRLLYDTWLQKWWDPTYQAPNEPLVDGLRRSRMLGRLAFRESQNTVQARITEAVLDAVQLNADQLGTGKISTGGVLQVFIAAGVAGGTGSSGFLTVLRMVHAAARATGVHAEVWPVLFLPGVFAAARAASADPHALERAHLSNAYAFFRELDHVISVDGAFDDLLTAPKDAGSGPEENRLELQPAQVVAGVLLVDAILSSGLQIDQEDAYSVAASVLYDLLVTDARRVLGVDGVNTRDNLIARDATGEPGAPGEEGRPSKPGRPGKRRCYGSIGVARVVFPGSTYRRYLRARCGDLLLSQHVLGEGVNTAQREREGGVVDGMLGNISDLLDRIDTVAAEVEEAAELTSIAARLATSVGGAAKEEKFNTASEAVSRLEAKAQAAARLLETTLRAEARLVSLQLDSTIDSALAEAGQPLSVLIHALEKLDGVNRLEELEATAKAKRTTARSGVSLALGGDGSDSIRGLLKSLQEATGANWFAQAFNRRSIPDATAALGEGAKELARQVRSEQIQAARLNVIQHARERVQAALEALRHTERQLQARRSGLATLWREDHFEGKDIGPRRLSAYVPEDVTRDVDQSSFAVMLWNSVLEDLARDPRWISEAGVVPALRDLYRGWLRVNPDPTRGMVGFGSDRSPEIAEASRARFDALFGHEVDRLADVERRLPANIFDAVERVDKANGGEREQRVLMNALENMVRLSDSVCVAIDAGRIRNQNGSGLPPAQRFLSTAPQLLERLPARPVPATLADTRDAEAVDVTSVLTGFPVHAVNGMPDWRRHYRDVLATRRRNGVAASDPPPHIDARFASRLDDVMPRMYRDDDLAEVFAWAALIRVLQDLLAEPDLLKLGGRAPIEIRNQREGLEGVWQWVGTEFTFDGEGALWGGEVVLGTSYREVFDTLATRPILIQGIDLVFEALTARIDAAPLMDGLLEATQTYLDQLAGRAAEIGAGSEKVKATDLPLLELIAAQTRDLQLRLKKLADTKAKAGHRYA